MALPTNLFDESWYLARNPDVAAAIEAGLISSALDHFNLYGKFENRAAGPLFNPSDYLAANPDVAEAVQAGLISAYDHFMQYGASESRSPLSLFDPEFYLAQNPDVAAAVEAGLITATEHFLLYGQGEPRQINPFINLGDYMNANADIAEAAANGAISPLTHLLTHGAAEGRDLGNGINLGIFANDPRFQEAVESGNLQAALERVEEVAPFLPTFEPPADWEPPADTPIPTDFTPPEGTKLVIPPSVNVPDDVELPDNIFEPVTPPAPTPPAPTPTPPTPGGGGGGGGGRTPQTIDLKEHDVTKVSGTVIDVENYSGKLGDKIVVRGYTADTKVNGNSYPFIGTYGQQFVQTTRFQRKKDDPIDQSKVGSPIPEGQEDGLRLEFQRNNEGAYVESVIENANGSAWANKWPFVVDLRGFKLDGDYVHIVQNDEIKFEAKIGNTNLTGANNVQNFLEVEAGNYSLTGGNQNDILKGSNGANTLNGGGGDDVLIGGGGHDTFVITAGNDTILDFNKGEDSFSVSHSGRAISTAAGQKFIALGGSSWKPGYETVELDTSKGLKIGDKTLAGFFETSSEIVTEGAKSYDTFVDFHDAVAKKQNFIDADKDHMDGSMLVKAGDKEVIIVFGREQDRVAVINLTDEKYASATFGANGDIKPNGGGSFNDLLKLVLDATKNAEDAALKDADVDLSEYSGLGDGENDTLKLIGIGITDGLWPEPDVAV